MNIFAAYHKFDPSCGESWSRFIEWSGLRHVAEIVSADSMLCPSVIDSLVDDDWDFNVHADNRVYFFRDFEYLKRRINFDSSHHNILSLTEGPTSPPTPVSGFVFCGYDILDSYDSISVLTNCGGFPSVFTPSEINSLGLIDELARATTIAQTIRSTHPYDPHCCDCQLWGIARYVAAT